MKIFEKPQYALDIKNNLCSFIAFINDIPAFNNMQGAAFNMCVPVNHLIRNGKNTFKVLITPLKTSGHLQELSDCFVTIIVKDYWDNANTFIDVAAAAFPAGSSNDTIKLPGFELAGEFEAKLPFADYFWVDAPKLDENKSVNTQRAAEYFHTLHAAMKRKDTSFLFNEITRREKEFSAAFYEDFSEGFDKTKEDFNGTFADANYVLQDLNLSGFIPRFYADGRIITFENEHFEQPIYYLNNVEFTRRQYPFYLCMNEARQFVVVR